MAQVKLLKIGADGIPTEHTGTSDDVTFATLTINSGLVASSSGIDMNNDSISDVGNITFTDATSSLTFNTATDTAGELDQLMLPKIAGTPTATPTNGEAACVWDSTNNLLYVWDGSAWNNAFVSASVANKIYSSYTATTGGVSIRDVLSTNGTADEVQKADANADSSSHVVGLAVAAASGGAAVNVQSSGLMAGFTSLTSGAVQYLSETAGAITETIPTTSGANIVRVGYAKNTTTVDIQIEHLGRRA
jgi:hypothetical protein